MKKFGIKKTHTCNRMNFSSNVNEVIGAVLNSLYFFYRKTSRAQAQRRNKAKAQRHKDAKAKAQNANKQINYFFTPRCF